MKRLMARIIDPLIPADIQEFAQIEERARARALIFLLLINLMSSVIALIGSLILDLPATVSNNPTRFGLGICLLTYAFALWLFNRTALFNLTANIYAATVYITILTAVLTLSGPETLYFLLPLFSLPLLVAPIANLSSSLLWTTIITITPSAVKYFDLIAVSNIFTGTWMLACSSIFLTIYIGYEYREGMSRRLNTERTRFEFAAAHDALTGLANRTTFDRRLRESIEFCKLHDTKAVLAYIDLDQFKPINDTYGHQAGDIVLSTVADRLRKHLRTLDTVARLGGDEFGILFDQCDTEVATPLIARIAQTINEPIKVFDRELRVSCSIGIVVCPDDGLHPEQLAHKADERMYAAKRKIKNDTACIDSPNTI
ncbi:MAG: GGDEF domain-containing protein [Spongiibacteraceae bacterium]